jgi:hypothetical protein
VFFLYLNIGNQKRLTLPQNILSKEKASCPIPRVMMALFILKKIPL